MIHMARTLAAICIRVPVNENFQLEISLGKEISIPMKKSRSTSPSEPNCSMRALSSIHPVTEGPRITPVIIYMIT